MEEPHQRRLGALALKLAVCGLASFVLFELSLRVLLFHDSALARRLGAPLRAESSFANRWSDSFWILRATFETGHAPPQPVRYDGDLGWLNRYVEPGTYAHEHEPQAGERRPVLLYGDSFADCAGEEPCWQDMLAESPLGERFHLLNYGTGGYGLDQSYLLFERSIDRHVDRDPVVILSLLVDDDLDRSMLGLREWPKPRFSWSSELGLELERPTAGGTQRYLETHTPGIWSYGFRYLVYGADLLPQKESEWLMGERGHAPRTRELNRRILDAWHESVRRRGLDAFVLLFHGEDYVDRTDWRERFLSEELARLAVPYVSARLRIRAARAASGLPKSTYYLQVGPAKNHLSALGNEVVFDAIVDGLEGRYDGP